ncbi:MAG TPA: HAMP domain-containing protein [Verrucomicrobiae bacterium]|nr:HAMP domain-containing protein [Verrucomicrobiae bacterium]
MKSLRWRLTLWFAVSLLVVVVALMVAAHWHLDYELRQEKWEHTRPSQPGWVLHGSFTDQEVHDILGELAEFWLLIGVPLVGVALASAYFIARHSIRPVQQINQQLDRLGAATLSRQLQVPDTDPEIGQLVRHFNKLLGRLDTSFTHLQSYTAQVAHELRTPLQLMRLRIESNAAAMDPALAEELQEEIAHLANYVETALAIARAEQGRLELTSETIILKTFLADTLELFSRLAEAEHRKLLWSLFSDGLAVRADRAVLKQILFNLLNNALTHGAGNIHLRIKPRGRVVSILIGNNTKQLPRPPTSGLGIGLRLVNAFAQQMPGVHFRCHRSYSYFWAQLRLPAPDSPDANRARVT